MGFLRRLVGRDGDRRSDTNRRGSADGSGDARSSDQWPRGVDDQLSEDEVERERALLRGEAERLDDELLQRQLRYADRAWTPPKQGGERRADDADERSG